MRLPSRATRTDTLLSYTTHVPSPPRATSWRPSCISCCGRGTLTSPCCCCCGRSSMRPKIAICPPVSSTAIFGRSEEHTSELQSLMRTSYAVFCLKKKNTTPYIHVHHRFKNIIQHTINLNTH